MDKSQLPLLRAAAQRPGLGPVLRAYFRAEGKQAITTFLNYSQPNRIQVATKQSYLKQSRNHFQQGSNLEVSPSAASSWSWLSVEKAAGLLRDLRHGSSIGREGQEPGPGGCRRARQSGPDTLTAAFKSDPAGSQAPCHLSARPVSVARGPACWPSLARGLHGSPSAWVGS